MNPKSSALRYLKPQEEVYEGMKEKRKRYVMMMIEGQEMEGFSREEIRRCVYVCVEG